MTNEKQWHIPVTWEMTGVQKISAKTLDEALDKAKMSNNVPPTNGEYVEGSLMLDVRSSVLSEEIQKDENSHRNPKQIRISMDSPFPKKDDPWYAFHKGKIFNVIGRKDDYYIVDYYGNNPDHAVEHSVYIGHCEDMAKYEGVPSEIIEPPIT